MTLDELNKLANTNPKLAADELTTLIKQQEAPAAYYELLGHCLLKLQQTEAACDAYQQALALDDQLIKAHFGLAQALQKLSRFAEALKHLQICLQAMPEQNRLLAELAPVRKVEGGLERRSGVYTLVHEDSSTEPTNKFSTGVELCKKSIVFLFQAGTCYLQLGEIDSAKQALEQVLTQDPYHLEALINYGSCLLREKNYQRAIEYFATACRVNENYPPALYNLACALMEHKRFLQARDRFELYLQQMPNDLEACYHLGYVYLMLEELTKAQHCFQQVLDSDTNHLLAMHNLASIALKQNEISGALGFYQRILAIDPNDAIANYMSAALTQKTPPDKAPEAYVQALFDQYADRFDQHLTEELHYQTPQLLYQLWQKYGAEKALSILDLGCGTGLMAPLLKPHAKKLIGIDLSEQMLNQARSKNLYDALHQAEINHYLAQCHEHFDLVVLADVLVYFGDLTLLLQRLKQISNAVLFSIEHTEKNDYALSLSGRYQHNLQYVLQLAKQMGFHCKTKTNVCLRKQNNQDVLGDLVYCYV